jgi:hypothetical protein
VGLASTSHPPLCSRTAPSMVYVFGITATLVGLVMTVLLVRALAE